MIDRRCFRYFDWISFLLIIVLLVVGLLFVFSATYKTDLPFSMFFKKQLIGAGIGLVAYLFFSFTDLRSSYRAWFIGYFVLLCLLLYTLTVGRWVMGAQRWISLGFIRFQPSELTKFFLPLFIAYYFCETTVPKYKFSQVPRLTYKDFLFPLGVLAISFILIRKQPDLGTALIVLGSGLILLWFVGLSKYFFIIGLAISLAGAPIIWKCLRPYQQDRVLVLLGYGNVRKERYQIEQSKIAIGSGGVWGKGFLKGTQNKLNFLPEDHTDFIFSVICEEIGLVGALLVLLLFGLLFVRLLFVVISVETLFEQIVALGLLLPILLSVCINIGMVIGLLPIVGIPLPLVSYGMTNLIITLASLGWINNIAIRRFYY